MNTLARITASAVCLALFCTLVVLAGRDALQAAALRGDAADRLHYSNTAGNTREKILYFATLGIAGEDYTALHEDLDRLAEQAAEVESRAGKLALASALPAAAFLLLPLPATGRPGLRRRRRARRLVPLALIALAAGIAFPMLSAVSAVDLPFAGKVVLESQSKSILTAIAHLWHSDPILSVLIALFSVVTPVAKLALLFLLTRHEDAPRLHAWVERVGRWSMTDVFVVALLLTFLSLSTRNENTAHIELGLYFFTAAALLPIAAMELLPKAKPATATVSL